MLKKGLIQVYTGSSKQPFFSPVGLCLRAAGHGFRTLICSFTSHELMDYLSMASSYLKPNLVVDLSATERVQTHSMEDNSNPDKIIAAFHRTREALFAGGYDIIVLNGINQVSDQGILSHRDILDLVEKKPPNTELVLSGPGATAPVIERADLVTEMVVSETNTSPKDHGSIEVITGNGKGKTTYCLGKAMLISCMKIPSFILQVIKSQKHYGEVMAIENLPYLEMKTMGEGFLNKGSGGFEKKHIEAARKAWKFWLREIFSLKYDLLVLDEINIATHYGLINAERVKEMLFLKPEMLNILLSGRNAHPDVMEAATTVIEMKEIKHPFKKGIKARRGIEF